MAHQPKRVALTGGIATGKSYCLQRFAEMGAAVIDADVLARQAVEPGTEGFRAVIERFGAPVVAADGSLNRESLGRLVFGDIDARRALEAIVHPAVYSAIARWFETLERANHTAIAIADIPLLFETGRQGDFEAVVVAACPPELQVERLVARTGLSEMDARGRIATQMPIDDKVSRADYVVDTSGTFEDTDRQIKNVWSALLPPSACS